MGKIRLMPLQIEFGFAAVWLKASRIGNGGTAVWLIPSQIGNEATEVRARGSHVQNGFAEVSADPQDRPWKPPRHKGLLKVFLLLSPSISTIAPTYRNERGEPIRLPIDLFLF